MIWYHQIGKLPHWNHLSAKVSSASIPNHFTFFNGLLRLKQTKTKLRMAGPSWGIHQYQWFSTQKASNVESVSRSRFNLSYTPPYISTHTPWCTQYQTLDKKIMKILYENYSITHLYWGLNPTNQHNILRCKLLMVVVGRHGMCSLPVYQITVTGDKCDNDAWRNTSEDLEQ